jgi:hypothetical protein
MRALLLTCGLLVCVPAGCLPNGPPTGAPEGKAAVTAKPVATVKKTAPRGSGKSAASDAPLNAPFSDSFERGSIGEDWRTLGGAWKVQDGKLCGQQAHNRGIWLARRLPVNARIEWEGSSASADGDIKAELWGDGLSGATGASYTNATSYLLVLGGWKNTLHVLARLDEHGADRLELRVDRSEDDPRARPVSPGQVYHFRVERLDGRTISWFVDEVPMLHLADPDPLTGLDHDHFGFNDWETPVCFDNVKITPLPG